MADFGTAVAITIINEGGSTFINHPADKGGATRYGVTIATLSAWRKKPCSTEDVRGLTEQEAKAIFEANYWTPLQCAKFGNQALACAVFDAGVLTGINNAARMLQECVGAVVDGKIGPKTLAAVNGAESLPTIAAFSQKLQAYVIRIVQRDKTQAVFLVGWIKRAAVMQAMPFLLA